MKLVVKKIVFFMIIALSLNVRMIAQREATPEEIKVHILTNLQSEDPDDRFSVINSVVLYEYMPEALPILERDIWKQDQTLAYFYMIGLDKYKSTDFISIAHNFIHAVDTMRSITPSFWDSLELKVRVTGMLFKRGDFSTANFVFDLVEREKPGTFINSALLMKQIIENHSQYEPQAKEELIRIAKTEANLDESATAIYFLIDLYGEETPPILSYVFTNHSYRPSLAFALERLIEYNYPGLDELLRNKFITDSEIKSEIPEYLLQYYPSIQNYKYILDHLSQIDDTRTREWAYSALTAYEQKPPDSSKSVLHLIGDLETLIDTLYNYRWVSGADFKNDLKNRLLSAKTNLQNEDSINCVINIKSYQSDVDTVYKDSLNSDPRFVTREGWKFLFYNAQYILNKLPGQQNPNQR